jgi:enterochelin esterase-like enzyme
MNAFIPAALLLLQSVATAVAQAPPRVVSPEISPDRRVTFRVHAPKASEVLLSGEFMRDNKKVEMTDGIWSVTVGPIEPEIYHYTFTIDGVRTIDPSNAAVKTGSTANTLASILEVRGETPAFYDDRPVPHGEIRTHWYPSPALGSTRRLTVYTPPGYDRETKTRYPVMYLLHGANADENAWYRLGRMNLILDNLLAAGTIKPFLVVMPLGYGILPNATSAPGQNTALFRKALVQDVIPFIESHYRASSDRAQRAIVGLSMGGGQALTIGLNDLSLFSHVAGFSSGFGPGADFATTYASLVAHPDAANKKLRLLWVGCGKDDGALTQSKSFSEFLNTHQIRHTFRETDGAHTWIVWRRYLNEVAPLLFQ